ncbi:glycosyltransferase [Pseudonocardia phyllosphaerae]|uniref:glycosyltransferase n=1 Tax=Pseudonocardia phyllosphaerae TaxID=3390502 RepID=UPI003978C536
MLDTVPRAGTDADSAGTGPVPGRLVVQRGPFAGPTRRVPEDLYSEVLRGVAERDRERLHLVPGTHVTTNTYWGRFHATYWQRWSAVPSVQVSLRVGGHGHVWLMASDTNKVARAVEHVTVDGDGTVTMSGPIDRFLDGGGMWLEFVTETGELTVSDVYWTVGDREPARPVTVTICTYNRVADCLETLRALAGDAYVLDRIAGVRVVDQGSDPLEDHADFAAVAASLGAKLTYQRQPNLGGAGGFTRGLWEATAGTPAEDHDVLLMDDDVLLDPEIVIRLIGFGACTTRPTIVGGQMLNLLHPGHLHISAEFAMPEHLRVGIPVPGALNEGFLLGRDERDLPTVQDRRVDTEYNGWWSCLIPAPIVRAIGYPLPVFFQWDDIEYGYRAREHGFPTVSLPGAGVWHADFGWKDWDEWHRYFNQRNGLITAALRTGFDRRKVTGTVVSLLGQYLIGMQYGLAATLLTAVEDFLEGPQVLDDGSAAAAAKIRRIRSAYPETAPVPVSELDLDPRESVVHLAPPPPSRLLATWAKRVLLQTTGRLPFRSGMVPAGDAHWWFVSLFEKAIVTDMAETGVRIREYDRERLRELSSRAVRAVRRLRSEGPAVARQWKDAEPRLTDRATWTRLYDQG